LITLSDECMLRDEVIYGRGEVAEDDDKYRCPICISRIDEFGYCACGGNLGVS
jgi:hypothetical protein